MSLARNQSASTVARTLCTTAICCAVLAPGLGLAASKGGAPSWTRLVDNASAREQVAWGQRYENGERVTKNIYRAVTLYCAAAAKGDALAAYRLGRVYASGAPGLKRDDALAAAWFRRSAAKGASYAKGMLELVSSTRRVEATCRLPKGGDGVGRLATVSAEERKAVEAKVHAMAPRYGLDPRLGLAVSAAESAFDKTALSPKGAQGLMQRMPGTASRFGVQDAFDPEQNLRGGMTYLAWLLEQFPGRLDHAIAAYNAGEEAVEQYRGIPPYAETREYVRRVLGYYGVRGSKDKRG
jgi:soluble lytic murein transglycosylase-like protein